MDHDLSHRLSRINTSWHVLRQAHEGAGAEATAAQQLLIERYGPAVRRYLLGGLRDADAADELVQEFSLALVRNDRPDARRSPRKRHPEAPELRRVRHEPILGSRSAHTRPQDKSEQTKRPGRRCALLPAKQSPH